MRSLKTITITMMASSILISCTPKSYSCRIPVKAWTCKMVLCWEISHLRQSCALETLLARKKASFQLKSTNDARIVNSGTTLCRWTLLVSNQSQWIAVCWNQTQLHRLEIGTFTLEAIARRASVPSISPYQAHQEMPLLLVKVILALSTSRMSWVRWALGEAQQHMRIFSVSQCTSKGRRGRHRCLWSRWTTRSILWASSWMTAETWSM